MVPTGGVVPMNGVEVDGEGEGGDPSGRALPGLQLLEGARQGSAREQRRVYVDIVGIRVRENRL